MAPPKRLPKVYVVRHGPTEWSLNGRHTGTTDLPLTESGEKIVKDSAPRLIGSGKVIDPALLQKILISPRQRARRTFDLLFEGQSNVPLVETEENVREWTYGDYEGLWKHEAIEIRKKKGLPSGKGGWDIWFDGCEGGESPQEMSDRVDVVVKKVRELHRAWAEAETRQASDKGGDVLIVTHGHFSRCFVARWLGLPLDQGRLFVVDTGTVTVGQYYHELDATTLGGLNIG